MWPKKLRTNRNYRRSLLQFYLFGVGNVPHHHLGRKCINGTAISINPKERANPKSGILTVEKQLTSVELRRHRNSGKDNAFPSPNVEAAKFYQNTSRLLGFPPESHIMGGTFSFVRVRLVALESASQQSAQNKYTLTQRENRARSQPT